MTLYYQTKRQVILFSVALRLTCGSQSPETVVRPCCNAVPATGPWDAGAAGDPLTAAGLHRELGTCKD